jgi:hypothetical protein
MTTLTCSVSECEDPKSPKAGQGMCGPHYRRWKQLHSPRCTIEECDKPKFNKDGLCSKHFSRLKRHGSTSDDALVRGKNEGDCPIEGCDNPMRSAGLCAAHASQKRRIGEAKPFGYKWAVRGNCKVCGKPCTERGRREYCSSACQVLVSRYGAVPPETVQCGRCGDDIDLGTPIVGGGRKGRLDRAMCDHCFRARTTRHKMSVSILAQRDGADCTICGEGIDMTLRHPEMRRASVDHVIPYSLGGTHDPENLALAHLVCNIRKSNRAGWTIMA